MTHQPSKNNRNMTKNENCPLCGLPIKDFENAVSIENYGDSGYRHSIAHHSCKCTYDNLMEKVWKTAGVAVLIGIILVSFL